METTALTETRKFKSKSEKFYTPTELIKLFQYKDVEKDWSFIEYKPSDTSKLTHCYHRYPAKFIPQLVERLMDGYLIGIKEPHVNDLFMGSGTTIACAKELGRQVIGYDIAPYRKDIIQNDARNMRQGLR